MKKAGSSNSASTRANSSGAAETLRAEPLPQRALIAYSTEHDGPNPFQHKGLRPSSDGSEPPCKRAVVSSNPDRSTTKAQFTANVAIPTAIKIAFLPSFAVNSMPCRHAGRRKSGLRPMCDVKQPVREPLSILGPARKNEIAGQQRGAVFEAHRGARRLGSGCSCWRWAPSGRAPSLCGPSIPQ